MNENTSPDRGIVNQQRLSKETIKPRTASVNERAYGSPKLLFGIAGACVSIGIIAWIALGPLWGTKAEPTTSQEGESEMDSATGGHPSGLDSKSIHSFDERQAPGVKQIDGDSRFALSEGKR